MDLFANAWARSDIVRALETNLSASSAVDISVDFFGSKLSEDAEEVQNASRTEYTAGYEAH